MTTSAFRRVPASSPRLRWSLLLPALLGAAGLYASAQAAAGSWQFYAATFATAAVWFATWLRWGDRGCFDGPRLRELARGLGWGVALLVLFIAGAVLVRHIPVLAGPVSDLLDNMRLGSVPLTLSTLVINGVGEELYFRDVARRQLSARLPRQLALVAQLGLYVAVTAAMGIPLLLVASVLIGGAAALEARRAGNLVSATTLHLVWSVGMAFLLPAVIS